MRHPTIASTESARAERFADRMLGLLNDAFLALMVSVGHRTRLFEVMAGRAPSSSDEIARAAGLHERYVREWLGAMVCGRIVDYDGAHRTFWLPPEHAASLVRAARAGNLAMLTQYVAAAASVEGEVVECFHHGGGVPHARHGAFQQLQAAESAMRHGDCLVDTVVTIAPGVVDRLRAGAHVLDVGCGHGVAVNLLAQSFPCSQFVGLDVSPDALALARGAALARNLVNARFERTDVAELDASGAYDLVTAFDVIRDLARPADALRAIRRVLTADGTFLCGDVAASSDLADNVDHTLGTFLYASSTLHSMTISLAQAGAGLGAAWGEQLAQRMLRDAGFAEIAARHVAADPNHVFYVAR